MTRAASVAGCIYTCVVCGPGNRGRRTGRLLHNLDGALLVLEDTGEAPYRVDRMLTHWRTAGLLGNLAGVGIGRFGWRPDPGDVYPGDLSLDEVLMDRLGSLGVPVISDLPVGHGQPNKALIRP